MQTSLAALYKGSGFVLGQMREEKGRGEGSREGEGSSRAGKRKRVEKKNVCAHREAAWLQRHRCLLLNTPLLPHQRVCISALLLSFLA